MAGQDKYNYLVKTKAFNLVTESYSRDRGKQNGAIVTIFSLITIFLVFKSRKEVVIKAFVNSRMFSSGVFIFLLALIRSCVWFYFNFVSLLPFLIFLFICRGGSGGKPQCFILLTEFWQLSCFITMHKLFLRDKLFFKSLILTRTTTISKVNFYCYSIVSFFLILRLT